MKGKISKELHEIMRTSEGRKQFYEFLESGEQSKEITIKGVKYIVSRSRVV